MPDSSQNGMLSVLSRLSHAICRIASGKVLAASFLLWIVTLILINGKPFGLAGLQEITGGPTILDMTLTTSPEQVYAVLDALGDAGREFYLTHIVPLDLVFPFTYALFLSVLISWTLSHWHGEKSPWLFLNLAPIIACVADYCENAGVITLLLTYPAHLDPVAMYTSVMYLIKFVFTAISYITVIAALAGWAVTVLKARLRGFAS